jgi:hypothetical protein
MKLTKVTLFGRVRGNIWMPRTECTKDFEQVYTPNDAPFSNKWNGIRSALLRIINDGDFQSCEVSELGGNAEYQDGSRRVIIPLVFNPSAKEYADCLTDDILLY